MHHLQTMSAQRCSPCSLSALERQNVMPMYTPTNAPFSGLAHLPHVPPHRVPHTWMHSFFTAVSSCMPKRMFTTCTSHTWMHSLFISVSSCMPKRIATSYSCTLSSCASCKGPTHTHLDALPLHRCISSCMANRISTPYTCPLSSCGC